VRSRFGNGGKKLLRRIGQPPKRAFMFYTAAPFAKMQQVMDPPDDSPEPRDNKQPKIEILAKGQHVVVDGAHPDTHQPYTWTGGEPWTVHIGDLPELSEAAARTLLDHAVGVLVARGWRRKESAQRDAAGAQAEADDAAAGDVPLMVRLATRLWGPARAAGRSEWRFGARGSKHVDASAKQWFDFEAWRGGTMRDLMRMVEETRGGATEAPAAVPRVDMSQWDDVQPPRQEWAVWERAPCGHMTLFSGAGAGGKSLLMLQLCVAHVVGRDWLGNILTTRGPAIFWDAEDDEGVIHRRMSDILRYYDVRFTDVRDDLHVSSLLDVDPVLGAPNRRTGRIEPTLMYDRLLEMAGDVKPVMISIASSANVFAGNKLDRAQVQQFVSLLTRVARTSGGGLILISHPSLAGLSSGSGLSGSTQWHNAVRARLYIKSTKNEDEDADAEPRTDKRTIEFMKNNYGPVSSSVTVRYRDGVFVPLSGGEANAAERLDRAKVVFLTILARYNLAGVRVNTKSGHSYAPAAFAAEVEARRERLTKDVLRQAMMALLVERKIEVKEYGPPSSRHEYLAVVVAPQN
jgi:RecA-family ATPase